MALLLLVVLRVAWADGWEQDPAPPSAASTTSTTSATSEASSPPVLAAMAPEVLPVCEPQAGRCLTFVVPPQSSPRRRLDGPRGVWQPRHLRHRRRSKTR